MLETTTTTKTTPTTTHTAAAAAFQFESFCMDLAIKKAKTVGVGWVCANNSNHYGNARINACLLTFAQANRTDVYFQFIFTSQFILAGIAGWHAIHAQKHGLIGISMTNTSPILCPTRSKKAALGTNPISVAAPAKNGDSLVLGNAQYEPELKCRTIRKKYPSMCL